MRTYSLINIAIYQEQPAGITITCTDLDTLILIAREITRSEPESNLNRKPEDEHVLGITNLQNPQAACWFLMRWLGQQGWEPFQYHYGFWFRKEDEH